MSCYYAGPESPRLIRGRHGEECPAEAPPIPPLAWAECAGCQPCTLDHCLVQWHGDRGDCQTHAVSVCPACVGKVREHLSEIVRLSGLPLVEEVLARGTRSEAADLLGPVANAAQWRQRGDYGHIYHPDSRLGDLHPLWVLGTWDLLITEHLGHKRTQRAGIRSSSAYIDLNLTYLAADMEFDFPSLANEAAACRTHLENVLHDGEQIERNTPCMKCKRPLTKTDDGYRCQRCQRDLTDNQYRLAVRAAHVAHADRLNADDMAERIGVLASTFRSWASVLRVQRVGEDVVEHDPLIRSCGRDGGNRKVYRVKDALAIRDSGGDRRRSGIVSNEGAA